MNDEPFDSTFLRNKLFEFKLGAGIKKIFQNLPIDLNLNFDTMKINLIRRGSCAWNGHSHSDNEKKRKVPIHIFA